MKKHLDYMERVPDLEGIYQVTNESLPAMNVGLDLSESDKVLAIAGSGDQAFAMLEFAGEVVAVDVSPYQIKLVEIRKKALLEGDVWTFLDPPLEQTGIGSLGPPNVAIMIAVMKRNRYFSQNGRLKRIREKADQLRVLPAQDFRTALLSERTANKFYLSNAFNPRSDNFMAIYDTINSRGTQKLVYASDSPKRYKPKNGVRVDQDLTRKARVLEARNSDFHPTVFRT